MIEMSLDVDRSVTHTQTHTDRRTNIDLGRGSYTIAPKGAIKINPAREAREILGGYFRRFTGENAQKGVQKGSKKCYKIGEIFWKKK